MRLLGYHRAAALVLTALFTASLMTATWVASVAAAVTDYTLTIKTADEMYAGTDSNIFVRLHGSLRTSDEYRLNGQISGNAFERNDTDHVTLTGLDLGRIWKIDLRSDGAYAGSDWRLNWIEVSAADPGISTSTFDFYQWCDGCSVSKNANDWGTTAWVEDELARSFNDRSIYDVGVYDNLYSRGSRYTLSISHKIRNQVQASRAVTDATKLGAKVAWKSPKTVAGTFSAEFSAEWQNTVTETKAQLSEEELSLQASQTRWVPRNTLWLCKVAWRADWDVGMLDAGQPMGVRWLSQQPRQKWFTNVTLKFGDEVPKAWRQWIRANLPQYVPPKLRHVTGPFTLYKPKG